MIKKSQCCLVLAVLLIATKAIAQAKNDAATNQLKMLFQFKGKWQTQKASLITDGKTVTFPYQANFTATANNHGLLMTEQADIPGVGKLFGANLAGVSPYDGKVHWFSVDNIDVAHEHIGSFTDGKHFSMTYRGIQNGKEYIETLVIEFPDVNTLTLNQENLMDGKQVLIIKGTFKRVKT